MKIYFIPKVPNSRSKSKRGNHSHISPTGPGFSTKAVGRWAPPKLSQVGSWEDHSPPEEAPNSLPMEEGGLPHPSAPLLPDSFWELTALKNTPKDPNPGPWFRVGQTSGRGMGLDLQFDSVLDAEPQLVAKVWSPDQHGGYWGTPHDIQLHPGLILQALQCR